MSRKKKRGVVELVESRRRAKREASSDQPQLMAVRDTLGKQKKKKRDDKTQ
jgi:hypothetical protein